MTPSNSGQDSGPSATRRRAPEPTAPDDSYPPGPPPGPDLDCSGIDGPVWVGSDDPHRLDRDGDGIGCEAN